MDAIYAWVKSIVFYLILLTVVTHLIPSKKYEKYIKLFTGMLLVMIVIKPVTHIFSWDVAFDQNFVEMLGEGFGIDDTYGQNFENVQEEQMVEEYQRQVKAFASAQAESLGMNVVRIRTQIERQEGILIPTAIEMDVTVRDDRSQGESSMGVGQLDKIKIADIVAGEHSALENEQTKQLQGILMKYYGLEENQVQVVVT